MTNKKRKIGFDLDGVVVNIYPLVYEGVKMVLGVDMETVFRTDKQRSYWVDTWPEIMAIPGGPEFVQWIYTSDYVFRNAPAIDGAIETLNNLNAQGHEVYFATSRPLKIASRPTKDWFSTHDLGWACDRIYFADQIKNGGSHKAKVASTLGLEIFVDDSAETIANFEVNLALKLVPVRDWNRDQDIGMGAEFVSSWQEIENKINNLT
jgi:phosphoglycolate phosphatase-like HAD superfamily hydrolase